MNGGGPWQRVLLMVALVLGVVAMHTMVLAPGGGHDSAAGGSGHVAAAMSSGPPQAVMDASFPAVHDQAHQDSATHHGPGSPAAIHDLLHLCLAVLAALAVMAALAVVWLTAAAATRPHLEPGSGATAPARPPPRSAVRLALLCVLRN